MPKCAQCENAAIFGHEMDGVVVPLCMEHSALWQQITHRNIEMLERAARQAERDLHGITGLPLPPHLAQDPPHLRVGDEIRITGTVGVFANRGARVSARDVVVHAYRPPDELNQMAQAILDAQALSEDQRTELLQLLQFLTLERQKSPEQRSAKAVFDAALTKAAELTTIAQGVAQFWPAVQNWFKAV